MTAPSKTAAILTLLDATKINKEWYDQHGLTAGYHTIEIDGKKFKGQRDPQKRLQKIKYDFRNKRVIDIGCSNGGFLQSLAPLINFGIGIDNNPNCINAANALKSVKSSHNLNFYCFDLDRDDLSIINSFGLGEKFDVCLFLCLSLWVKRWKEVFLYMTEMVDTILFESHGSDSEQMDQLDFVRSVYNDITLISDASDDDPTYTTRKMYVCNEKIQKTEAFNHDITNEDLAQLYASAFTQARPTTIKRFPSTQGSAVFEVDEKFIVKVQKPSVSHKSLRDEKRILDFMSNRLPVTIPSYEFGSATTGIVRYAKINGAHLTGTLYDNLADPIKGRLAKQIATIIFSIHQIPIDSAKVARLKITPTNNISLKLIETQLVSHNEKLISDDAKKILLTHRKALSITYNSIVGHFDLHGSNFLLDTEQNKVKGLLDFGDFSVGDAHKDLSKLYLISTPCAENVFSCYERISGKPLNRHLIKHHMAAFFLDLLARLKARGDQAAFSNWLAVYKDWRNQTAGLHAAQNSYHKLTYKKIPEAWKTWIAESIIAGHTQETIEDALRKKGFDDSIFPAELAGASSNLFVEYARNYYKTNQQKAWLMAELNHAAAIDPRYSTAIETIPAPSFDVFMKNYYSKNLPVLIKGGIDHWPAIKKWTPDYFKNTLGDTKIEVQYGRSADAYYERNAKALKKTIRMGDFVDMIQGTEHSNDFYMTANNAASNQQVLAPLFDDVGDFGSGYRDSDTIRTQNLLWLGPKGTITPIHYDILNNMFVQIYGHKKVTLIPALQQPYMYNDASVYSSSTFPKYATDQFPLLNKTTPIEIILTPGDALFIPVGWWHMVESQDTSISLTFNNFSSRRI